MKSIQIGFYLLRFAIKFWIICNVFAYVSYIISILMSFRVDSATLRQNQNFIVNNFYDPYVIIDANVERGGGSKIAENVCMSFMDAPLQCYNSKHNKIIESYFQNYLQKHYKNALYVKSKQLYICLQCDNDQSYLGVFHPSALRGYNLTIFVK